MTEINTPLATRLDVAKRTCQVLYSEVQQFNLSIQDTTLQKASHGLAPIPQKRYLRQFNTLKGHQDKIAQIRWSADSSRIVSACQDGFMIIWDAVSGLKLQAIALENPWVLSCAFAPSGKFVASGGLDNRCTVYKVQTEQDYYVGGRTEATELRDKGRKTARSHAAYVSACAFISDDQVLTASGDMTIALWDMHKDCKTREFLDHCGDVTSLSLADGGGQTFLSGGIDGSVKLWDVRAAAPVASCQMSKTDVSCVAHVPTGHSFICGDDDGVCKFYDFRSLCPLESYNLREQFEPGKPESASSASVCSQFDAPGVVSLDVSRSGRMLYACYADYGCLAWDVLRKEIVESIGIGNGSHTGRISQVATSPDGQGLATASWDSTIKVWTV